MSRRAKSKDPVATTGGHGYAYIEHHAWMLTPPWITLIGLGILGLVLHLVLSSDPITLAWGVFGLTMATTVLTVVTLAAGRARGGITAIHATVSVVAGGLWLVVASIVGLGVWGLDLAALLVGAVIAAGWNIRRLLRGSGTDGHRGGQDWGALADDVKTLRARIRDQRTEGATRKVTLDLPGAMTAQQAQGDVPAIAAALGVPANGVRMVPDPDDAGRVELAITPEDMLRHTIHWPGPTATGRSIAEPVNLGDYEDGQDLALRLPGRPGKLPMSHIILIGMTGAGKSELIQVLIAEAGTRVDVVIDYLDVAGKAEQTVGPLKSAIRTLITDKKQAKSYLRRRLAEVPDRARALAGAGMREWQEGAPIPFELCVIDEGASLVSDSDDFVEMCRVLRSVGILIVLAIQRATYDQMPTSARANFGTVVCFGVRSERDAAAALSEGTLEAGARPHLWRNRKPGYLYLEAPGIPEERFSMPARAYLADAKDVERILIEAKPLRYPTGDATAMPVPAPEPAASRELADAGEEADVVDEDDEATPRYQPSADLAREMAGLDPDAELADIPGVDMDARIGPPERVPPLTPEQAREALDTFLAEFRRLDGRQFQRRDLIAAGVLDVTSRGKGWVSGQLGRMVDEGMLEYVGDREDGVYAWVPEHAHAGHAS